MRPLLLILLLTPSAAGFACTCTSPRTVADGLQQSVAVLEGTVSAAELVRVGPGGVPISPSSTVHASFEEGYRALWKYALEVSTVYKGRITSNTVMVYSAEAGGACGANLQVGLKYIVYSPQAPLVKHQQTMVELAKADNVFWTMECTRTQETTEAEREQLYTLANCRTIRKNARRIERRARRGSS